MTNEELAKIVEVLGPVMQAEVEGIRALLETELNLVREQVGAILTEHGDAISGIQYLLSTEQYRRLVIRAARDLDVKPSDLVKGKDHG